MKKSTLDTVKRALVSRSRPVRPSDRDLLSTGSTLLNLSCTGVARGGVAKGQYLLLVGDSESGKTWLALSMLAEASVSPHFADYLLVLDQPEQGAWMDLRYFFGRNLVKRLRAPASDGTLARFKKGRHSESTEGMYDTLDNLLDGGTPFVYVLDSENALETEEDREQIEKEKKARQNGKDAGGSYGTSKAKTHSNRLRKIVSRLGETGSILVILSQTRMNIGHDAMFNPKTRSGGVALRFYAHVEVWTSVRQQLKTEVKGVKEQTGVLTQAKVKKSRVSGRHPDVTFPIYWSHGLDDVGSCVQYLVDKGHWSKSKGVIDASKDLDVTGKEEELIRHIEEFGAEEELHLIVQQVWQEIEDACSVKRKARYR